jgi:hypothetical protein
VLLIDESCRLIYFILPEMRFHCGVNLFTFFFFLISCSISAQVNLDSVPTGVITVQRPPIKATYRVQLNVLYEDPHADRKRVTEISSSQIVFTDSGFSMQPQPLLGYEYMYDDSLDKFVPPETVVATKQFDWAYYLTRVQYEFKWADSTRSDSARFIYNIDKKGNATCNPLPWPAMDSGNVEFEKKARKYMQRLTRWSAASKTKTSMHFFKREKSVACIVLITIYAYDPYAGRLMPIEISGK